MEQLSEWEEFYKKEMDKGNLTNINISYPDVMKLLLDLTTPESKCIEVGCGSGSYTVELLSENRDCIGLDQSKYSCEMTKKKAKLMYGIDNAKTVVSDIYKMPFEDNTFDLIFSDGVLEHLDIQKAMKEIKRIMKPGGHFVAKLPIDIFEYKVLYKLMHLHTFHADELLETPKFWKELFEMTGIKDIKFKKCGSTNLSLVRRIFKTKKYDKYVPHFFRPYGLFWGEIKK